MRKSNVTKIILFIAVICFLFQLVPADLNFVNDIKSDVKESKEFIKSKATDPHVYLARRLNKRVSFQNTLLKNPSLLAYRMSFESTSQICSFSDKDPFDYRRTIRKCIPHYFNGSKYKNETLII